MKILVACEESQAVTKELKEKEVNEKKNVRNYSTAY